MDKSITITLLRLYTKIITNDREDKIEQYCFLIKLGGAERFSHKIQEVFQPPEMGTSGDPRNP